MDGTAEEVTVMVSYFSSFLFVFVPSLPTPIHNLTKNLPTSNTQARMMGGSSEGRGVANTGMEVPLAMEVLASHQHGTVIMAGLNPTAPPSLDR